jgi:endonuclease-3
MRSKDKTSLLLSLAELYPNPHSELDFSNEYQLLIAVILSAQCTDKKVNQVTPTLFKRYRDFKALSKASLEQVEQIIRPINYFKTKSKNIIETAKQVVTEHWADLPKTREGLISLPGVGRKTANVVLGELGIEPSFPVDTHVFRVAHRLGLTKGRTPDEVEDDLKRQFPPSEWRNLHHRFIFHGRRVCKARTPECSICPLAPICPSALVRASAIRDAKQKKESN